MTPIRGNHCIRRMARRAALVTGLALTGVVLAEAAPAAAHTVSGAPQPTNYRSRITGISPPVPGLDVRLLDLGRRVELTNRTATDVIVLGYEGEPYLRVGPAGVFENRTSPTLAQNRVENRIASALTTTTTTVGGGQSPPVAGAPPDWQKTSSGRTVRWRDHRTRWEGPEPPAVKAEPDQVHVVSDWQIQLRQVQSPPGEERPIVVAGRIVWVPGPNAVPWLVLALVLLVAVVALAFTASWGWWLSLAIAILVATDVVNTFASAAASESAIGVLLVRVLLGAFISTAAWIVGALAIGPLQRGRAVGLFAAGLAALIMTLYTIPDALTLGRSQLPFALPPAMARAAVATVLGLGLGVLVSIVIVFKRHPELLPESNRPEDGPPRRGAAGAAPSGNGSHA